MTRFLLFLTLTNLTVAAPDAPELKAAEQALHDQLPEVALTKLERLIATPKLPTEILQAARVLLVEAAVRAGQPERGLELTEQAPLKDQPGLAFWRAAAFQARGSFRSALTLLQDLSSPPDWPYRTEAKFNEASLLMGLGEAEEAGAILAELAQANVPETAQRARLWLAEAQLQQQKLADAQTTLATLPPSAGSPPQHFLLGKLELARDHGAAAASHFNAILQATDPSARAFHLAARIGLARSQRLQGERATAARTVGELISGNPSPRYLELAFQEFRIANRPPDPEMEKLLQTWMNSADPAVSAPSHVALIEAREAGQKLDEALQLCAAFIKKFPNHPLLVEVLLRQSRMLIRQGQGALAVQLLVPLQAVTQPAQVRAWAAEVLGYAELRAGNFTAASQAFKQVTSHTAEPEQKLLAKFQSALATLQGSPTDVLPELTEVGLTPALAADLQIERGLYAASKAAPQTDQYLQTFLQQYPEHPRTFEAALARAEIALPKAAQAPEPMRQRLTQVQQLAKTPADLEKVTLLSLHFDSISATPEAFAKRADAYLTSHAPGTKDRADVLFKLAERLHNAQQYAPAKARFLQLVKEEPESVEAEAALFYAGKATLGSLAKGCEEEAIQLWDKVAQGKGPLRLQARLEQGKLDQRLNPTAALQIFDTILKAQPPPDLSLKNQVLCLRGETLLVLSQTAPDKLQEAMNSFDQVLASTTATTYWKQQALVRKGDCLVTLKQDPAALEAYYEAMKLTPQATTAMRSEADNFWFFRAGEKAMRLLEAKQDWKAAVSIAQKLAEAPGRRADTARERANRLITEHYLWQDE